MKDSYDLYLGGSWTPPVGGEYFETRDPADGSVVARVARARAEDVEAAVLDSAAAFPAWRDLDPPERGRRMLAFSGALLEAIDELAEIETSDNGKPVAQAKVDVMLAARYFEFYAGLADKLHGEVIPLGPRYLSYTRVEPFGVTAHIVPWNAPIQQAARGLAPALVVGNTAVAKPAEDTPLSCLRMAELAVESGLPPGVLNVVPGYGTEAGAALVRHPSVRKVTFTGSVETGIEVAKVGGERLVPLTLELGGKGPNIVFADADLEAAAVGSMRAITINAGQACSAGSRLLVDRRIHDQLVETMAARFAELRVGPGREEPDIGPVTTADQFEKVQSYLAMGPQEGARVVVGGGRSEGPSTSQGFFVEPTIFSEVSNEMRIAREEIFGPVLVAIPFDDEDEAVAIANDTSYGLTAGMWTRDLSRAHRVAAKLEAGQIFINEWFAGGVESPFGGYKNSGYGREKGVEAVAHYTQVKSVVAKLETA